MPNISKSLSTKTRQPQLSLPVASCRLLSLTVAWRMGHPLGTPKTVAPWGLRTWCFSGVWSLDAWSFSPSSAFQFVMALNRILF